MASLTMRTDAEVEGALRVLMQGGLSRSGAVRSAILDAERAQRRAQLRAEAEALRQDPEDVAAARAISIEMRAICAW